MKAARKREWGPGEYEAALVAAAVSGDVTRETMNKPFGRELHGRGFICGTDGHRLHAIACDAWQAYKRDSAPPAEHVIPWDARPLGEIQSEEAWEHFPAKWDVAITLTPGYKVSLLACVIKGSGKNVKRIRVLNEVAVDWPIKLAQSSFAVSLTLSYLADAVDFIGTGSVYVWGGHHVKNPELAPLVFTPTSDPIRDAKRLAVVMPRRL